MGRNNNLQYLLLAVLILLLGVALRYTALMRLPLNWLEAANVRRAHLAVEGQLFTGLMEIRKWLFPAFLSLFRPTGPEGPWLTRMISALLATSGMAACIALGRLLDGRRAGLFAGLFYAVLPMTVFHERQGVVDPLMATFTTLMTLFAVRLARRPRLIWSLLLGATLAGAYLAKVSALPYIVLPGLAVVLFTRRVDVGRAVACSGLALVIALSLILIPYQQFVRQNINYDTVYSALVGQIVNLSPTKLSLSETLLHVLGQLNYIEDIALKYVGWGILALVILAGLWAILGENRRSVLFLTFPAILFGAAPIVAVGIRDPYLAARYLLANAAPLVILAALGLSGTLSRLSARRYGMSRWVGVAFLAVILGPALWFDVSLIRDPAQVALTDVDRFQYIIGQAGGYGHSDVAAEILETRDAESAGRVNVLATGTRLQLQAYLGPRVGLVNDLRPDDGDQCEKLAAWLARGDHVFFVETGPSNPMPSAPHGARLEWLESYDSGWGTLRLFRVIGADGALADAIYARLAPEAERMAEDYAALAATLEAPGSVLIFPAGHASTLAAQTELAVIPMEMGAWPLETPPVEAALDALNLGEEGAPVQVILADEAHTDPNRVLIRTLQNTLYRVDDAWFGYLHRLGYVTGPTDPEMALLEAHYEGVIELVSVGVLDTEAVPGDAIRMALEWRSPVEIQDSFRVFVHAVDAEGNVWAQHDAVPGDGLMPMPSWQPGEGVIDRFAIRLPTEIPPGIYEIRVGLYYPESGVRLSATDGPAIGPDYVVVGLLTVSLPE